MKTSRALPIAIGASLILLTGVADATSTTCTTAAGAFGLNAVSGGSAPAYGVLAYGSVYCVYGIAAGPGNGTNGLPTSVGLLGNDTGGDAESGGKPHPEFAHRHHRSAHPATPQQPLDPFARLKARVGSAEFARELQAARKIETVP